MQIKNDFNVIVNTVLHWINVDITFVYKRLLNTPCLFDNYADVLFFKNRVNDTLVTSFYTSFFFVKSYSIVYLNLICYNGTHFAVYLFCLPKQ